MIKSRSRLATIALVLIWGAYFNYHNNQPVGWRDLMLKLIDCMQLTLQADRPSERSDLFGEKFVWSDRIEDWTLTRDSNERTHENAMKSRQTSSESSHCIWPEDSNCTGDRIINQLRLKPHELEQVADIFIAIPKDFSQPEGRHSFKGCNFNRCQITSDLLKAHAIVFHDANIGKLKHWPQLNESKWRQRQIWIAYLLESPPNTFDKRLVRPSQDGRTEFNWTATYRHDSDIVTPYSKFVPYADSLEKFLALKKWRPLDAAADVREAQNFQKMKKMHSEKQGKVAWFVSNCNARNNRLEYARELSKYIQVDIFGECGNYTCSKRSQASCLQLINERYKFYLSFENSNNRDYITEKFYLNALGHNDPNHWLLPIVMGPSRANYESLAPTNSFIHTDDFDSPKELASYLKELDSNEKLYERYFEWKNLGRFIDTKFLCRTCALLHRAQSSARIKTYKSLRNWWLND